MACLGAISDQIATFLSAPFDILFLRHPVFREYAKIAVGPDFIHTFPSLVVLVSMCIVLWKKTPNLAWLPISPDKFFPYKLIQICLSWVAINGVLWLWLIFQRIIYCEISTYWNHDLEHHEVLLPWWQRVWATYYPPPLEKPVTSAGFVSWIASMFLAFGSLVCALVINRVGSMVDESLRKVQEILESCNSRCDSMAKKFLESVFTTEKLTEPEDNSEVSSICEDRRSEISIDAVMDRCGKKRQIHSVSNGTNWFPPPKFSSELGNSKETKRNKASIHALRVASTVGGTVESIEHQEPKFSPRQLRNRRGAHTVIGNYGSDKSSGC